MNDALIPGRVYASKFAIEAKNELLSSIALTVAASYHDAIEQDLFLALVHERGRWRLVQWSSGRKHWLQAYSSSNVFHAIDARTAGIA